MDGASFRAKARLARFLHEEMGFEVLLWRVTLRPGSPFSFGLLPRPGGSPIAAFGLLLVALATSHPFVVGGTAP